MKISQAQKIVKDSRYGADKKKEARKVLREAKKAGKPVKPTRKKKTKASTKKKVKSRARAVAKSKSKSKKTRTKKSKLKRKTKSSKTRTRKAKTRKTKSSKTRTRKTKTGARKKTTQVGKKIKFYDVKTKKHVRIPREDCRVKRSRSARGGDRLVGKYKGRELHTFVPKGFTL